MKNRYLPLVLVASLLLLIGSVAAGCGSDDDSERDPAPTRSGTPIPPDIDDYLAEIAEIFDDTTDEIGQIEASFENDFARANDEEDADEAFDDALKDYQRTVARASGEVNSLRPAAEATIQHDALAAALDRAVTSMNALEEEYQATRGSDEDRDVTAAQAALAASAAEAFALISAELEDACLELQTLAVEHAVEVDLVCGEEAPAPTGQTTPTDAPA